MKAIDVSLRNPYLVAVMVLAVFVIGYVSMKRIPADLLPQFKTPAVQIVTFYPGMPPEPAVSSSARRYLAPVHYSGANNRRWICCRRALTSCRPNVVASTKRFSLMRRRSSRCTPSCGPSICLRSLA